MYTISPKQEDFDSSSPLPLPLLQPISQSPASNPLSASASSSPSSGGIFQVVGFSSAEGKKITHQSGTYEDKKKNIRHLLNAGETLPVYLQILGPARRTEPKKLVLQLQFIGDEHQQSSNNAMTISNGYHNNNNQNNHIHTNGLATTTTITSSISVYIAMEKSAVQQNTSGEVQIPVKKWIKTILNAPVAGVIRINDCHRPTKAPTWYQWSEAPDCYYDLQYSITGPSGESLDGMYTLHASFEEHQNVDATRQRYQNKPQSKLMHDGADYKKKSEPLNFVPHTSYPIQPFLQQNPLDNLLRPQQGNINICSLNLSIPLIADHEWPPGFEDTLHGILRPVPFCSCVPNLASVSEDFITTWAYTATPDLYLPREWPSSFYVIVAIPETEDHGNTTTRILSGLTNKYHLQTQLVVMKYPMQTINIGAQVFVDMKTIILPILSFAELAKRKATSKHILLLPWVVEYTEEYCKALRYAIDAGVLIINATPPNFGKMYTPTFTTVEGVLLVDALPKIEPWNDFAREYASHHHLILAPGQIGDVVSTSIASVYVAAIAAYYWIRKPNLVAHDILMLCKELSKSCFNPPPQFLDEGDAMNQLLKKVVDDLSVVARWLQTTKPEIYRRSKVEAAVVKLVHLNSHLLAPQEQSKSGEIDEGSLIGNYKIIRKEHTAEFSQMLICQHNQSGEHFSIKAIDKNYIIKHELVERVKNERVTHLRCSHPCIVRLFEAFQDEKNLYFVMEYVPSDLFTIVHTLKRIREPTAKYYVAELILAIKYLHQFNIVHRDIKLENVLIDKKGHVKLTEFSISLHLNESNEQSWSFLGTPEYMAPEVILVKGHGKAVDWWALGIVIYHLLAGQPPFIGDDLFAIFDAVIAGRVVIPAHFSNTAQDIISQLLAYDPQLRLGARRPEDIMAHPWFNDFDWTAVFQATNRQG